MSGSDLPRIVVVDDEEAILETMSFTFMDDYEVFTTTDAHEALRLVAEHQPVHVVITDQRMPGMTGVELLKQVYERYPETMRIMLTGFADGDATLQAINEGHVYAYISKPWEPEELKQVVRRATEHSKLAAENRRLVADLEGAVSIMQAVMDRLEMGAIAIDREHVVQAANKPALALLRCNGADPRGRKIDELLGSVGLSELGSAVRRLEEEHGSFEDMDLRIDGKGHQIRISSENLPGEDGGSLGRVILFKEISHEPLRRRLEELVAGIVKGGDVTRETLERTLDELQVLAAEVKASGIDSIGMSTLSERVSRSQTAIQNWLDVDEELATNEFPDAQLLIDRMRVATQRWPYSDELPESVRELGRRVEAYYESGENPRQRVF
jgi:CheY-like chemotaxis protein